MSVNDTLFPEPSSILGALTQSSQGGHVAFEQMTAMGHDEIAAVREMIQQYSNYPGVVQAFAAMVSANSHNPDHLASLVREMVDQIEQVRANPHARMPVNPAISQAVEAIREAELQKPDPLNFFRGGEQGEHKSMLPLAMLFDTPIREVFTRTEEPEKEPASMNPLASLIAGLEISRELRDLNASAVTISNHLITPAKQRERDSGVGLA